MGGRTIPSECPHGVIFDWGDFGPTCPLAEEAGEIYSEYCLNPDECTSCYKRCEKCDGTAPPTYPRWEHRPDEPGKLAWITDPDDLKDDGFDIEELFAFLAWRGDPECQRAVQALVDLVNKENS